MLLGWIWIAALVLSVVLCAFTRRFFILCLAPALAAAVVMDILKVDPIWQIITVFVISLIFLLVAAKFIAPSINGATKATFESVVGERCVVTEKIDTSAGRGQVKVRGQIWSAKGIYDDDVFDAGEVLLIVAVEGVRLICKKG